jgi:molybdenum cofactor guanylyltransferase
MRQDKARLQWNGHLLIEEVAAKVRNVAGNIALVGHPERYSDLALECLPDLRLGLGPLAGIEAALASKRAELSLIVACDMPGLEALWLCALLEEVERSGALCVVGRDRQGSVHPLCGVYRSSCLGVVRRALDQHRLKLMDVINELRSTTVDIDDAIRNINTPSEWAAWQQANRGDGLSEAGRRA